MGDEHIFSWAEDADGNMVHVDSVARGLKCNCFCPYCHEPLVARHGDVKEHGFAHHSQERQSRLEMCYMVTLYKLAEQIIQKQRSIMLPSYYGIFPSKEVAFSQIKIDSRFEREDKQPDVVATTADGKKYLIEFTFEYKVQHKQSLDYSNLNCIEIDLSRQTMDTLPQFLTSMPNSDWRWLNNALYFNQIEGVYARANKLVRVVCEDECQCCELTEHCCAVKDNTYRPLVISNNGKEYRMCKSEMYALRLKALEEERIEQERERREYEERQRLMAEQRRKEEEEQLRRDEERRQRLLAKQQHEAEERKRRLETTDPSMWSCFDCACNSAWANRNGYANCGCYSVAGVPKITPPDSAKTCRLYRPKL